MPARKPSRSSKQIAIAEYAVAQHHLADSLAALVKARQRAQRAETALHNLSLDASQEALKAVQRVISTGKVNGEDLLGSPELKRQLREAKVREKKRSLHSSKG